MRGLLLPAFFGRSGDSTGLRTLRTVFGAALAALIDTEGIERTTDDVVTNTWKVLHPSAANEDDGVFLEVVAFTADVGDDFESVSEAHFGHFTESRVRLLGRPSHDLKTYSAALWAVHESG
jgi:hypothetical protein